MRHKKGFTLIELVVSIMIAGILGTSLVVFIYRPISAYLDVARRAELVDNADQALRRMARDIQRAVPNSLRTTSGGQALEMVNIVEGMRYRVQDDTSPADPNKILNFTQADSQFDVIGLFQNTTLNSPPGGTCVNGVDCPCTSNTCRLVIYNTGANGGSTDSPTAGANVYSTVAATGPNPPAGSYTISPTSSTVTLTNPGTEGKVTLSTAVLFAMPSPRQRVYVVDTPVSYICSPNSGNPSQGTLFRYSNYTITQTQPTSAPSGAQSAQLAKNVTACSFVYTAGSPERNGLITMTLTLSKGGESITLLRQVAVGNAP